MNFIACSLGEILGRTRTQVYLAYSALKKTVWDTLLSLLATGKLGGIAL